LGESLTETPIVLINIGNRMDQLPVNNPVANELSFELLTRAVVWQLRLSYDRAWKKEAITRRRSRASKSRIDVPTNDAVNEAIPKANFPNLSTQ
jgi:hypothetical protein